MSLPAREQYDDQALIRYLLGTATEEETERFDELSIADESFAWRLQATECDLVDAYVSGELAGETLERFRSFYLLTAGRRRKVEFAQAFLTAVDRVPANALETSNRPIEAPAAAFWRTRRLLAWGLAVAACVLVVLSVYLFSDNQRLRQQVSEERAGRLVLEQQEQAMRKQLAERSQSAGAGTPDADAPVVPAIPVLSLTLFPQTRGTSSIPAIVITPGVDRVRCRLVLESDDFPQYQVALKDPASNLGIWQSGTLQAASNLGRRVVTVELSAGLFLRQHYNLELTGISSSGAPESIGSYVFLVKGR